MPTLNQEVVYRVKDLEIVQFSARFFPVTFKIRQGAHYVGKLADGGYRSKYAAIKYAQSLRHLT